MTYQELQIEIDMLQGNVNRIYVADSHVEQIQQRDWAIRRTNTLFDQIKIQPANIQNWILHKLGKILTDQENTAITSKDVAIDTINAIYEQIKIK